MPSLVETKYNVSQTKRADIDSVDQSFILSWLQQYLLIKVLPISQLMSKQNGYLDEIVRK